MKPDRSVKNLKKKNLKTILNRRICVNAIVPDDSFKQILSALFRASASSVDIYDKAISS